MAGRNAGGPETYEVELIRALSKLDPKNEYIIYCTGPEAKRAIAVEQANFVYRVLAPPVRTLSVGIMLPFMLARDGVDFYHATFTPPPYSRTPLALTIHCVSSLVHPEFYRSATTWRLNRLLKIGITRARHIMCVSRTTMQHLQEMYGVALERMSVTYNGVAAGYVPIPVGEAAARVRAKLGIDSPYFLFVGKVQAHKNIKRLIQAFRLFRKESGSKLKLVIVGRSAGNAVNAKALARTLGLENDVVPTGYVPFEDLPSIYSAARAFVFPSLWEGFGIPILEAMSCGTPVICSNATCLPEIAGGAAMLVNPNSVEEIAEAMVWIDRSEQQRKRLIIAGFERARLFTWEQCARLTLRAYQEVL
jgi:glycosyltransferase involved in cell wall biosynthesis